MNPIYVDMCLGRPATYEVIVFIHTAQGQRGASVTQDVFWRGPVSASVIPEYLA